MKATSMTQETDLGIGTVPASQIASAASPEDSEILRLKKAIEVAIEGLTDWLLDNTEKVFEEQPEIDDVRSGLQNVLYG